MSIEYLGLDSINGPLIAMEGVKGVFTMRSFLLIHRAERNWGVS